MATHGRNKSVLSLMVMSVGLSFFSFSPDVKADFELVDPTEQSYTSVSNTSQSLNIKTVSGFGHEVPLRLIMKMATPATWDVRYKSPELSEMKIDYRAEGISAEAFLTDIAVRYGLMIVYGESSGVITIDWSNKSCAPIYDAKTKSRTLC